MSRPNLYVVDSSQPSATQTGAEGMESAAVASPTEGLPRPKRRRQKIDVTSIPRDWQLSLPFDSKPIGPTVVIVAMEAMNGVTLRRLINEKRPAAAVDLRQLIRFDLPGTSREDVFHTLTANRTHYIKDPLPWHRLDMRDMIVRDVPVSSILIHEIADRGADCIFVFVYRSEEGRYIAAHLTRVLGDRLKVPWRIEEAT